MSPLLEAQEQGILTWRSIWTTIGEPIWANAALAGPYGPFLDYLRVASTQHPPDMVGDPPQDPRMELVVIAPPADVSSCHHAAAQEHICLYLLGLQPPVGIAAQLVVTNASICTMQDGMVHAWDPPTLATKYPNVYWVLLAIC